MTAGHLSRRQKNPPRPNPRRPPIIPNGIPPPIPKGIPPMPPYPRRRPPSPSALAIIMSVYGDAPCLYARYKAPIDASVPSPPTTPGFVCTSPLPWSDPSSPAVGPAVRCRRAPRECCRARELRGAKDGAPKGVRDHAERCLDEPTLRLGGGGVPRARNEVCALSARGEIGDEPRRARAKWRGGGGRRRARGGRLASLEILERGASVWVPQANSLLERGSRLGDACSIAREAVTEARPPFRPRRGELDGLLRVPSRALDVPEMQSRGASVAEVHVPLRVGVRRRRDGLAEAIRRGCVIALGVRLEAARLRRCSCHRATAYETSATKTATFPYDVLSYDTSCFYHRYKYKYQHCSWQCPLPRHFPFFPLAFAPPPPKNVDAWA